MSRDARTAGRPLHRLVGLLILLAWTAAGAGACAARLPPYTSGNAPGVTLPLRDGALHVAVIGDGGTGRREQYEVGRRMAEYREAVPFELVLMLGDNIYGRHRPQDFERKFERPYQTLLDAGVTFQAAFGNHDRLSQLDYPPFNMNGRRYYSFTPRPWVRFFALDTTAMTPEQLSWLDEELAAAAEPWKICYFHHPIYSSGGRHGPDTRLRQVLEPIFQRHGVQAVFAGHEHFYERLTPPGGIIYFISGAAGQLRRHDIRRNRPHHTAGFDLDRHFMALELDEDELHFQVVTRLGETVDSGVITRR